MMPAQRRLPVTERERQRIRQYAQANPLLKQVDIARWASDALGHKIHQSIICKSLHPKWSYLDTKIFAQSDSGSARACKADYPLLESALCEWITHMEASGLSVTGEMIQGAASALWQKMTDFHRFNEPAWSQGWLSGFKRRHKIKPSTHTRGGQATNADVISPAENVHRFQQTIRRFHLKDIFSADETGLVWFATPDSIHPTEPCKQNMITILPTCNADGSEKLGLWIIGHVDNPRSFGPGRRYIKNLPFTWRHSKNAWMTTVIFIEYLHWFDEQMQGRNVLLLIDRLSAHVSAVKQARDGLRNITIEYIPSGANFIFQPMDQGIVHNLKVHYREAWLQHIVSLTMEEKEFAQNTTILSAIHWIIHAWGSVTADTISHCWQHSHLFGHVSFHLSNLDCSKEIYLQELAAALTREGVVVSGITNIDNFVNPPEEAINDSYDDLITYIADAFTEVGKQDNATAEQQDVQPIPVAEALEAVNRLIQFEQQHEDVNLETLAQLRRSRGRITQLYLRDKFSRAEMTLDLYSMNRDDT